MVIDYFLLNRYNHEGFGEEARFMKHPKTTPLSCITSSCIASFHCSYLYSKEKKGSILEL